MARGPPPPSSSYSSENVTQPDDIHRHYLDQSLPNRDSSSSSSSSTASSTSSSSSSSASVSALSFSFVATAVLISLFLLMAIFERFLRPVASSPSSSSAPPLSSPSPSNLSSDRDKTDRSSHFCDYVGGITVVMPGEDFPTFIAKPAPLMIQLEQKMTKNQQEQDSQEQEKNVLQSSTLKSSSSSSSSSSSWPSSSSPSSSSSACDLMQESGLTKQYTTAITFTP